MIPFYKDIEQKLKHHIPYDDEEKNHVSFILNFIQKNNFNIGRTNPDGHITASAWIINKTFSSVLLIEHKKLHRWLQPGGHVENQDDSLLNAALREAKEETNLKEIIPFQDEIFDVDVHLIPERKNEKEHYHLDIRYCFLANIEEELTLSQEIKNIKWMALTELLEQENESSIVRMVQKTIQSQLK